MASLPARLRRSLIVSTFLATSGALIGTAAQAQAAAPAAAAPAAADSSTAPVVQEIVVTAERRTTSIQRAAIAISSVSGKALDQSFTTSLTGLNSTVPSLQITKASGFENLVTIRGVGSETPENGLTTTPGVSMFIDGAYIANTISLDQTLFDIDTVQVLRGPQGALYGQSSIGGAILLNTQQPKLGQFSGAGDFSYGTYNLSRERLEVNIPLGDDFALRVSGQKFDHDGFTKDAAIPGFSEDDAHDASAKAALLFRPNNNFSATLTTQWYRSDQHGDAQKNVNDPESSPWAIYQDYPSHFALTTELTHLNLEYDAPWFIIKSVTAYQYLAQTQQEDSSRSAFSLLHAYDDVAAWNTKLHNYTEEFDILSKPGSKLDWTVGFFALDQVSTQFVEEFECSGAYGPCAPPTAALLAISNPYGATQPGNLDYGNLSHVSRQSYSAFAQATYHVTDQFRVTAGIRENLDAYDDASYNFSAFGTGLVDQKEWDHVPTWRVEGDYDLTRTNMIYASASRGYKPGGVNGKDGQVVILPEFKPETNTAFEVGSKNTFFDNSLRLNAAAFYYIHKDFQYIETDPIPFDGGISNIPSVHDYGVEFEGNYVAFEGRLHIDGNMSIERGEVMGNYKTIDSTVANAIYDSPACGYYAYAYSSYPPSAGNLACWGAIVASAPNIKGKQPPDMPEFSGSISASYRFDVPTGSLTPRVEVVYRGSEWARIFNVAGLDHVPAYTVTNLNLEYAPQGSKLRLSVAATNVFNTAGINSRYIDPYGTGAVSDQYIPPRQVIGTIAYAF